jgi:hypothetical protein
MKIRLRLDRAPLENQPGLVWRDPPQDYPAVLEVFDQVSYEDGSSEWKWVPIEVVDEGV